MRICIIGKYPPIQGGVSMRTYWMAHGLARLGHTVHVVTNAREATAPYRMFMREEDWARCEAQYGAGSVNVHWTESYGQREWHIPDGKPYATKLASLALELVRHQPIDLIYSYYLEPYAVAGHVVAQATELPHVVRTAGSDAGRLWSLTQFAGLYNHIFKSANAILCSPSVTRKMIEIGVEPGRIAALPEKHVNLLELFAPGGAVLDVDLLRTGVSNEQGDAFRNAWFGEHDSSLSYFGICGKLGKAKGTHSLLSAFKKITDRGVRVGLLVMGHARPVGHDAFREYVKSNGLEQRVCQLPFLPHWRVPEFMRRCAAVCCLEQDFPISFHDPVIAREVLTSGGCLVGSTEVIHKLPEAHKLIDGHNCIAVNDVNDVEELARKLISVIEDPDRTQRVRNRARQYATEIEKGNTFPRRLESILRDVVETGSLSSKNIRQQPAPAARDMSELVAG